MPARWTLSAISYQIRPSVSYDTVSVPGNARCSSDFPYGIIGSTSAGVARHQFDGAGDDAGINRGVDPDRKMRAVLLDRAHG